MALAALLPMLSAYAQWSGSVTAVSDYRYRGESLSDDKPALQGSAGYDHPTGAYAGLFASTVQFFGDSSRSLQALAYAGVATRLQGSWHGEIGGNYSVFTGNHSYDFGEIYLGVADDNLSLRLHYASDYFGQGRSALYSEVNLMQRVLDRIDVMAHVGYLRAGSDGMAAVSGGNTGGSMYGNVGYSSVAYTAPDRSQYDASLGARVEWFGLSLRAAWVGTNTASSVYPVNASTRRNTVVVSIAKAF